MIDWASVSWQSVVAGALLLDEMMTEAFLVGWEYTYRAERALCGAIGLRSDTLVAIEVRLQEYTVALVAKTIPVSVLALLNEVLIERLDFNDLLTLPASGQHRTLFPVVYIDGFFVEVLIVLAAEIAYFFIHFLSVSVPCSC